MIIIKQSQSSVLSKKNMDHVISRFIAKLTYFDRIDGHVKEPTGLTNYHLKPVYIVHSAC